MSWKFWKRRRNPLDSEGLRALDDQIESGELRTVSDQLRKARAGGDETHALRYLEARVYHEASAVPASELLDHLRPALSDQEIRFPEARLLQGRLLAATGALEDARSVLDELTRSRLSPALAERVRTNLGAIERVSGDEGRKRIEEQAEILATELREDGLALHWSLSDLARIDSLLDDRPEPAHDDRARWTSLIGEIAVRAGRGQWLLAPRAEDRAVRIDGREWPVGRAVRARLLSGDALYDALHRHLGTPRHPVPGIVDAAIVLEPGAHLTVALDHAARVLQAAGARGLGVLRERPTPDGPVRLPLSFIDKSEALRVLYIENRAWDETVLADLRRWLWRLRTSAARHAEVSLLSAREAPATAFDLVDGRAEAPAPAMGLLDHRRDGSGAATGRSLDEPKLRWIDEKAEVMERLVRAAVGGVDPSDLELLRKVQETVLSSFQANADGELSPKQWNGLYGYGSLFGRILARGLDARWSGLRDDTQPTQWEMVLPGGQRTRPLGEVVKLARLGGREADLVRVYMDLRSSAQGTEPS